MTTKEQQIQIERANLLRRSKARHDRLILERAAMVDLVSGKTGRGIGSGKLLPPDKVTIERGYVCWSGLFADQMELGGGGVDPTDDLLDQFVVLWKGSDLMILSFVQQWGGLTRPMRTYQEQVSRNTRGRESLSRWRALSLHAYELRQIAAALRTGDDFTFEYWFSFISAERALSPQGLQCSRTKEEYLRDCEEGRKSRVPVGESDLLINPQLWRGLADLYLFYEVQEWTARFGPASIIFGWHRPAEVDGGGEPWGASLDFGGSVLCYIGFQLGLILTGGETYICSACGRVYTRAGRRAPSRGTRNYCDDENCRVRERNRMAAARSREKRRRKKKRALKVRASRK